MQTLHIYLFISNQQQGPYAIDQIQAMWSSGSITADALFWHQGMSEWEPIQELLIREQQTFSVAPIPTVQQIIKAHYDPKTDSFSATMPLMMKLAMKAIQSLGWKLDNANESIGLVTFQTGMSWGSFSGVSCSLNIEETEENRFRVSGTGKQNLRGGQLIALDLGEAKGRAEKAIKKMKEISA
jgi:hypothetical protein